MNTYVPIFRDIDARGAENYEQTQTHAGHLSHSDDNNKDYSKRRSSIGIIQRIYTHAKPLNMKHNYALI